MRGTGGGLVPLAGGKDGLKPSASAFYRSAVSAVLDSRNGEEKGLDYIFGLLIPPLISS